MTATTPPPTPAAVAAFLRGAARRARLFASVQAGGKDVAAQQALDAVSRVFATEAGQWPISEWPRQYWRLLLAAPALRQPVSGLPGSSLHGIARLPADQRAAVLLHLVAGLDEADAAAAIGIDIPTYQARIRDGLPQDSRGQPDVDVWRAWRAAAERELARMPEPALVTEQPRPRQLPPQRAVAEDAHAEADRRHHRRMRWLWLGVLLCIAAMIATFFLHPRGRELIDQWRTHIEVDALDPAEPPKARYDAADFQLHPDRDLLAAPRELALARELPLLVWLLQASADPQAADAVLLPPQDLPAAVSADMALPASAPASALTPQQRMRAWDALPPGQRGAQRGAWAAWRALQPGERHRLRQLAQRWWRMAPELQHGIRTRFDALPYDVRHGAWLGPAMAHQWPRVAPLFAFAPEAQRTQLLQLLREASAEDIDAFERLAQSTPPEHRDAVRFSLLRVPAAQRRVWVLEQLQR